MSATYLDNHKQHNARIARYNITNSDSAIKTILSLKNSDFNNYNQMVKDIILICKAVKYE